MSKTTWNYRIVRVQTPLRDGGVEEFFQVHEVYYDAAGKIVAMTVDGCAAAGESLEELRNDLRRIGEALERPVLEYSDVSKAIEDDALGYGPSGV